MGFLKNFLTGNKANSANQTAPNSNYDKWANTMADVKFNDKAITSQKQIEPKYTPEPAPTPQPEHSRKIEAEPIFDSVTGEKLYVTKKQAQQNAIINYFQTGQPNNKNKPSKEDEKAFYDKLNSYEITVDDEEAFLKTIPRTAEEGAGEEKHFDNSKFNSLFSKIITTTTPKVNELFQNLINNHDQIYPAQLKNLLYNCETPRDMNRYAFPILDEIYKKEPHRYQELNNTLEVFEQMVFGEQYEYFKNFDELRKKAQTHSETFNIPNYAEKKELAPEPQVAFASYSKGEKAASGANLVGAYTQNNKFISAYQITEQQKRAYYESLKDKPNEDTLYINRQARVFCDFDGAGGVGEYGGSYASKACAEGTDDFIKSGKLAAEYEKYDRIMQKYQQELDATTDENERREIEILMQNIPNPLCAMANALQQNTLQKGMGGASTGIMVRIAEDNKSLDYLNVGDSRLYIIRNGKLIQISQDEGEGNGIKNAFGFQQFSPKQFGRIQLQPDDIVFICSDGVMGDWPGQEIDQQTIDNIIKNHKDPQEIVNQFIAASHKLDDTSAIAIKIPSTNERLMSYDNNGN